MTDRYPIPEFLRRQPPVVRAPVEHPILFSDPMVRAILAGTKTQTRRVVKPQPVFSRDEFGPYCRIGKFEGANPGDMDWLIQRACPYGQPGDRLWVREGFSGPHHRESLPPSLWHELDEIHYWADGNPVGGDWTRPRPSIHMPRWASRILLEITAVRVERLQDISEADAKAEGISAVPLQTCKGYMVGADDGKTPLHVSAKAAYHELWESINGPGSWAANPWVWVVEFKRVTP